MSWCVVVIDDARMGRGVMVNDLSEAWTGLGLGGSIGKWMVNWGMENGEIGVWFSGWGFKKINEGQRMVN